MKYKAWPIKPWKVPTAFAKPLVHWDVEVETDIFLVEWIL